MRVRSSGWPASALSSAALRSGAIAGGPFQVSAAASALRATRAGPMASHRPSAAGRRGGFEPGAGRARIVVFALRWEGGEISAARGGGGSGRSPARGGRPRRKAGGAEVGAARALARLDQAMQQDRPVAALGGRLHGRAAVLA